MPKTKSYISLSDLSLTYGLDLSAVCKMIKQSKIKTIATLTGEGNACKAIAEADISKLEKVFPQLKVGTFCSDLHITVKKMAEKLKVDSSGLHKAIRKAGYKFLYLRVPTERVRSIKRKGEKKIQETVICSGRPTPCLTLKDFAKFQNKK